MQVATLAISVCLFSNEGSFQYINYLKLRKYNNFSQPTWALLRALVTAHTTKKTLAGGQMLVNEAVWTMTRWLQTDESLEPSEQSLPHRQRQQRHATTADRADISTSWHCRRATSTICQLMRSHRLSSYARRRQFVHRAPSVQLHTAFYFAR